MFAFLLVISSVSFAWANHSLDYRKRINITSSTTLNDYQVLLNISYNSNMQTDFDDIRFYASDDYNKTQLLDRKLYN